jgi:hypothetical protein
MTAKVRAYRALPYRVLHAMANSGDLIAHYVLYKFYQEV